MPRRKGARVLGPYKWERCGRPTRYRFFVVDAKGGRVAFAFKSWAKAEAEAASWRAAIEELTVLGPALIAYEEWMVADKGNLAGSAATTAARVRGFFGDQTLRLPALTAERLRKLYDRRAKQVSVDTHRNELAEVKTFLRWAGERGAVPRRLLNELDKVKGKGRRSHGKAQLPRVDDARRWLELAQQLATQGTDKEHAGATAAMLTMLAGLRASEIVGLRVGDLDDGGHLIWVRDSKTAAGRRQVPLICADLDGQPIARMVLLRDALLALAEGKPAGAKLLGEHWRDWPRKWVQRICEAARVPKTTAHGMRGLHATLAQLGGGTAHLVAGALGHTSSVITKQAYIRPEAATAADQRGALRVIEGGRTKKARLFSLDGG